MYSKALPSNRSLKYCLCLGMLLVAVLTQAQSYQFKKRSIGVEDGLADRTINCFFQDRNGFMWMGTDLGLNLYDANRLTSFTREDGGLLFNQVEQISQDGNGNLWLVGHDPSRNNMNRVQILNPLKGEIMDLENYLKKEAQPIKSNTRAVSSHYQSPQLWLITHDHEIYFHKTTQGQSSLHKVNTVHEEVWRIIASPNGAWVEGPEAMTFYSNSGELKQTIKRRGQNFGGLFGVDDQDVPFYFDYLPGTETVGSPRATGLYYGTGNPPESIQNEFWPHKRFAGLDVQKHLFWADLPVSEGGGMGLYDFDLNEIHHFSPNESIYSNPYSIYFDRYGNGWANHAGRVNIVNLNQSKFRNYITDIHVFGINAYGARGLFVEGDTLYTNGLGPSFKVNLKTGEKTIFGPGGAFYDNAGDQAFLKRLALITDNQGNLWYTDEGHRVAKYDVKTRRFTDYSYRPSEVEENRLRPDPVAMVVHWSAFVDRDDKLWIGRLNGLAYLDKSDSALVNFDNYGDYQELRTAEVFAFHENEAGLWIGAATGLYLLSKSGEVVQRFHSNGSGRFYLPFNIIAHIREDAAGVLWLATKGGGLIKFNPETGDSQQWTTKDGLSHNVVYASIEDDHGYIWISSNKGIMRMSKADFSVSTYLKSDGLIHEEFNTGSSFKATDGRIFFGNLDGVTMFDPKDFLGSGNAALGLKLAGLQKQSKQTGEFTDFSQELFSDQKIVLRPNELGFILNFSLLDYLGAESNTYSYRINETDANWNYIDQPSVRINALPYGSYELKLRGQGPLGQWSEEISLAVEVLRPFYLKWWFFLFVFILLITMVYGFVQYRIKSLTRTQEKLEREVALRTQQITEQAEELKQMDKVKSRFFANVSHELRTPLTLILGPVSNLLRNGKLEEKLERELVRVERNGFAMSNLVEEILDLTKLDAKALKVSEQSSPVEEFFRVIFENFLSHARIKDIVYDYRYHGSEDLTVKLDQRLVDRIVSNLLSNAFKYTSRHGSVVLEVFEQKETLLISVNDSGMGISEKDLPHIFTRFFQTKESSKPVHGGTGIGLAISHELALLLGGNLSVNSEVQKGSTFHLKLPKKEHLRIAVPSTEEDSASLNDEMGKFEFTPNTTRVLLVEDNLDMQDFVKELLSGYHRVDVCNNGREGLEFLATEVTPHIIVSDIMMPEMDGLEFLAKLRAQPKTKDTPVLMLTARSAEEDKLEAFTLGVDDYLIKPFSVGELKARIRNLLKNAEARKAALAQIPDNGTEKETDEQPHADWLNELNRLTKEHVMQIDFNIASIAKKVGLSERQLQRNLKKITGLTPVVYVKEIRLQMAREYLEKRTYLQVKDVSRAVGFSSTPYFSQQFQDRFGKKPSEYLGHSKPNLKPEL